MGKLPPSMRSAKLPLALLKPPPTSTPSPSPSLHRPFPKKPLKKPNKKQNQNQNQNQNQQQHQQSPKIFDSPSLPSALATLSSLPTPHPDPTSLLHSFCSTGASPEDALSLFNHLLSTNSPLPLSAYHVLLTHTCLHPSADPSPVLSLILSSPHPPSPSTADIAVRSLLSFSRLHDASHLLLHHSPVDQFTFNLLLRALSKSLPLPSLHSFLRRARLSPSRLLPDLVSYTILIHSVCRSKDLREATRLLSLLRDSGFRPDAYLYNTVMKGYCSVDQHADVLKVYNAMRDDGVQPDLVTYNTLVFGLSKAGMLDQAKKFLKVMASTGVSPDAATYTSLMNGMCRKGDAVGALALLAEMEAKGCAPNECTYNTLLMGLSKGKCLDRAVELYGVMVREGVKVQSAAYASFVRNLCRASRIAEAYEVFDYALASRSLPDVSAYLVLESSLKWVNRANAMS